MPTPEDLHNQHVLLSTYRQTLAVYLQRRAQVGLAHVSPEVIHGILDARAHIRAIKQTLRTWQVAVEDVPGDEDAPSIPVESSNLSITDLLWPDGSILVPIPVRLDNGNALCLSKHPITNGQYRRFVAATAHREPQGEHKKMVGTHKRRSEIPWAGPFYPWQEAPFGVPDQPVSCVSFADAVAYSQWVDGLVRQSIDAFYARTETAPPYLYPQSHTRLPTPREWDYGAYGDEYPRFTSTWFKRTKQQHHNAPTPATIDLIGTRTNSDGVADMIGNVYEWCIGENRASMLVLGPGEPFSIEVRGGGFMDNLLQMPILPAIDAERLTNGVDTKHSDLGFRIAVELVCTDLTDEDQARLAAWSIRDLR